MLQMFSLFMLVLVMYMVYQTQGLHKVGMKGHRGGKKFQGGRGRGGVICLVLVDYM